MASEVVIIFGKPSSGKTASISNLPLNRIGYISTDKKAPNFSYDPKDLAPLTKENQMGNYVETDSYETVFRAFERFKANPNIQIIIVDTVTSLMNRDFMRRERGKGANPYEAFNILADNVYTLVVDKAKELRPDQVVYLMMHTETKEKSNGAKYEDVRLLGKLLEDKIQPVSNVNWAIYSVCDDEEDPPLYCFYTRTTSSYKSIARAPKNAFSDDEVRLPNDLALIDERVRKASNGRIAELKK